MSTSATSGAITLHAALAVTLVAAVLGLPNMLFDFPSFGSSLSGIAWKIATVVVMVAASKILFGRLPTVADVGLTPVIGTFRNDRTLVALPAIIVLTAVAMFWSQIPVLKEFSAAGSGASYEAGAIGGSLLAFELLVRYPVTVIAEESFFRGFLQPRVTVAAPIVVGVLFTLYHLQQWKTIPSLIPFGIALGLLRWWLGSIWPGAVFHYVGNAMFILSLR